MRIVITLLLLSVTASAAGIHRDEGLFVAYQQRLADRRTEALDIRRMNMLRKRYPVRSAAEISKRRTYQFANCHPSRADSLAQYRQPDNGFATALESLSAGL